VSEPPASVVPVTAAPPRPLPQPVERRGATDSPQLVEKARKLIGSLIYATLTRPDCKYPCSKLASVS
jgi:hypothetical protein